MASFKITGGQKLHGSIQPQGAKNEVLQILCAPLLTEETVRVSNIPDIVDVNQLIDILMKCHREITPWTTHCVAAIPAKNDGRTPASI